MNKAKIIYRNLNDIKRDVNIEDILIYEPIPNRYFKIVKINGRTAFCNLSPEETRCYQEKKMNQKLIDYNLSRVVYSKVRKKDY